MRGGALMLALCCTAAAQTQIERVKAKIAEAIARQSECICTQTIERVYDLSRGCDAKLSAKDSWDRLQLDVALRDGVEVYSFPGENEFDPGRLAEVSAENSAGTFGRLLVEIFQMQQPEIVRLGETLESGRRRLQFSFTLPQASVKRASTPYAGTVLVDAESFDLVRVVMRAPRSPGSACGDITTIDYAGNLPMRAQRRVQGPGVPRIDIDTVFSECRKLPALTSKTDEQQLPIGGVQRGVVPLTIPPRLRFMVEFDEDIDTRSAAAGQAIRGQAWPIIDKDGKQLVPAGAAVVARIMRIRHLNSDAVVLVVRLETIEVGGNVQPLFARPYGRSELGAALIRLPSQKGPHLIEKGSLSEWLTDDH
ncbi:MAG TPA: hypothetical protein VGP79_06450 [Bryobacteraceae bacterium]|jgi:hypothetical protein|nr:hypothetical protein [Bryobacteraceae bacterium]